MEQVSTLLSAAPRGMHASWSSFELTFVTVIGRGGQEANRRGEVHRVLRKDWRGCPRGLRARHTGCVDEQACQEQEQEEAWGQMRSVVSQDQNDEHEVA